MEATPKTPRSERRPEAGKKKEEKKEHKQERTMQRRQEGDHRKAFFTQEALPRADQKPTEKSRYETNPKASEHEFVFEQKTG